MLRLIKNDKEKKEKIPVQLDIPQMFCFGGVNLSVQMDKIKSLEQVFWYSNEGDSVPVLMITLNDGTKISVDFESVEKVNEAIRIFKKNFERITERSYYGSNFKNR